ncbi:MAG: type 4a pilus biogenesis protein PilO [Candidatus Colwellbacteria bacterium]|nr:type 4a pilus biogenesis protein PilO [Candidatus Colwellbacteria bacterium]
MPRAAKSRLTIMIAISLGILMVLLLALFLVSRDVQTQAIRIKAAKSDLTTRTQQLNDLARLREEAKQAQPSLAKLEAAIPDRDNLFSVRQELGQAASRNNLAFNFSFGNENLKENNLGSINFEMKLTGGDFNIRSFIDEVELNYPFVRIVSLDMIRQEKDFGATVKGQILFKG